MRLMPQTAQERARGASRFSASSRSRRCGTAIFFATLGLSLFGLSSQGRAQDLDDAACSECHATDQNETDGKELKAVTPELFKGTPHQALGCTACHKPDAAAEVPEGRTAHKPFERLICSVCHQSTW